MKWIRKIYNWSISVAYNKNAVWLMGALSFIESSFFPIPPDVTLIPMCIARRDKAFFYATVCTVASSLGGLLGYAIGYFLFETVGKMILDFYGLAAQFDAFKAHYNDYGVWIVFAGGFTPIPYKVITIASGVTNMALAPFFIASVLGRGGRFYLEALLLWKYGESIKMFIEKYMGLISILFLVLLIGGFVLLKYMV